MTTSVGKQGLSEFLRPYTARAQADLERWLVEPEAPGPLAEAMRYCALGGGKRLRPAIVYMAAGAVGEAGGELVGRAAAAVEMVHAYSLVHDDLPAMDDDALRRGRATAHVKFGEAMAILASDAILTRAFGVLGEAADERAGRLVAQLARGAGAAGMVTGQVADMGLCPVPEGVEEFRYIHLHKTAALLEASARMGALAGGGSEADVEALGEYARTLGVAFQVVDDVLDVTGAAADLGKTPGKDAQAGKRTAVAALGLAGAAELAEKLTDQAIATVARFGPRGRDLATLAQLLGRRKA
ncbi:MAG: polyprenyl synthetase family protein [Planctomycetota bacterium]|nr:polyprenyl synthetase family protein [Planctomycetota bacterium]